MKVYSLRQVYLDNAATTPPSAQACAAVTSALHDTWGNPSSAHTIGVDAERALTEARRQLASALGTLPEEVVFTSGGSEANALAILGTVRARARRKRHIITTDVEHSSVANACALLEEDGFQVTRLPADGEGLIHPQQVLDALQPDTGLVTMIWVNNEVGAIQPVLDVANRVKAIDSEVVVHADGVQAFGNVPIRLGRSALDLASFSAHKIRGPKGSGALWVRAGTRLVSPWGGGSQEGGFRPGTENVPGIAGFGAAAATGAFHTEAAERMAKLRDKLWRDVEHGLTDHVTVRRNGPTDRLSLAPHILNVSFAGLKGEVLVHALAESGVYVSTGSACSARRAAGSATLRAMGLSEVDVEGALRLSLSPDLTEADITYAAEQIVAVASRLVQFMR